MATARGGGDGLFGDLEVGGGGIYNRGDLQVRASRLSGNFGRTGGAIQNYGGRLRVSGGRIEGNRAALTGGGIESLGHQHFD